MGVRSAADLGYTATPGSGTGSSNPGSSGEDINTPAPTTTTTTTTPLVSTLAASFTVTMDTNSSPAELLGNSEFTAAVCNAVQASATGSTGCAVTSITAATRRARARALTAQALNIAYELTYASETDAATAQTTVAASNTNFNSALESQLTQQLATITSVTVTVQAGTTASAGGSVTTPTTTTGAPSIGNAIGTGNMASVGGGSTDTTTTTTPSPITTPAHGDTDTASQASESSSSNGLVTFVIAVFIFSAVIGIASGVALTWRYFHPPGQKPERASQMYATNALAGIPRDSYPRNEEIYL